MKIKKLNIASYGKLEDKEISFKDGLNIVVGPNESGKSTIRSFIFNLFFGGTVPGSTRALYTKDHQSYLPWTSNRYEGSAVVHDQGRDYHLYRNFNKGFEKLAVFDLVTGKDAKDHFKIDQSRKVQVFDENFFGINESTLRDLFEITDDYQMKDRLSYDLKDRIINHFSTRSEDISLGTVIDNIESQGFSKEDKKELGYLKKKLEDINRQLNENFHILDTDQILSQSMVLDGEINTLKEDLEVLEESLKVNLKTDIDQKLGQERNQIFLEKIRLEDEIKDLEESLEARNFLGLINFSFIVPVIFFGLYFFQFRQRSLVFVGLGTLIILLGLRFFYKLYTEKYQEKTKARLRLAYNDLDGILEQVKYISGAQLGFQEDSYSIVEKINDLKDKISHKAIKREVFFSQIKEKEERAQRLRALKEEKNKVEEEIAALNFKRQMKDQAIQIINKLSKVKFETVSKTLIEDCSEFIAFITKDKYSKLLINEDREILLFDQDLQKFVYIEDLSKATIGQVYFAYRLGLIVNSGLDFPIIIDDGFSLFDMDRNEASLRLLEKLGQDYQIILFTSNKRDLFLDSKNINIINLWS